MINNLTVGNVFKVLSYLSPKDVFKKLSNPQNLYDGIVLGLNFMPTKPVAIAMATIVSGTAHEFVDT